MANSEKAIEEIRKNLEILSTDDLLSMWKENNRQVWRDEAFDATREILTRRGVELPPQEPPPTETPKELPAAGRLRKEFLFWAVGLILVGIFHFLFPRQLNPIVGGALIVAGMINVVLPDAWIYGVNSLALLGAGIFDIVTGWSGPVMVVGIFLLGAGLQELGQFTRYAPLLTSRSHREKPVPDEEGEGEYEATPGDIKRLVKQLHQKREWIDWWARKDAAEDLGQIGPDAAEAVPELIEALHDEVKEVRHAAAQALQKIGGEQAEEALKEYRDNPEEVI